MDNSTKTTAFDEVVKDTNRVMEAIKKVSGDLLKESIGEELDNVIKKNLNEAEGDEDLDLDTEEIDATVEPTEEGDEDLEGGEDTEEIEPEGDIESIDVDDLETEPEAEVVDLVDQPDEAGIEVFTKVSDEDEIEVLKDGIKGIGPDGKEYFIKYETLTENYLDNDYSEESENTYEIEGDEDFDFNQFRDSINSMGDVDAIGENVEIEIEDDEELEEGAVMGSHTFQNGMKQHTFNPDFPEDRERADLRTESFLIKRLQKQNKALKESVKKQEKIIAESTKAINLYKETLLETHRSHTNLRLYQTLVTENATTKAEKQEILAKLEESKSAEESMQIFESFKTKFAGKETQTLVTESKATVVEKQSYFDPELKAKTLATMQKLCSRK